MSNKILATQSSQQGFTLIELLVVISIISLLASIVLTSTRAARLSASDVLNYTNLGTIQKALSLYYEDNNHYPISSSTNYAIGSNDPLWQSQIASSLGSYINSLPTAGLISKRFEPGSPGFSSNAYIYTGPLVYMDIDATQAAAGQGYSSVLLIITGSSGTRNVCIKEEGFVLGGWMQENQNFMNVSVQGGGGFGSIVNLYNMNYVIYGGNVIDPYTGPSGGC